MDMKQIIAGYMKLSTPNVSDGLDKLRIDGAPHGLVPLYSGCRKIVGPACTMKLVPLGNEGESPVLGTLEAIVAGKPGDVLVIDQGGRMDVNSYGGVAGFTTKHRGLVGCVIDGVTRDIDEFQALDLPVFGKGAIQQSIRNRCVFTGLNIEVQLCGVPVHPGDLIMSDENGTVVVPKKHIEEVLKIGTECKETEDRVIVEIKNGGDPVKAHEKVRYDMMTIA
jgi:4-hydroxy-4-methyl-2-oxoglutarate aldolase